MGGVPNEGDPRCSVVTGGRVSPRGEIFPLLPVNVQSPILFALRALRCILRSLVLLLGDFDAPARASDVFVQEFRAILLEERIFGCQVREGDRLRELGIDLDDLDERFKIAIMNSSFQRIHAGNSAILGVGKASDLGFQELFGPDVEPYLRVLGIQVDELGFFLVIRIPSGVIVGLLGIALFLVGVTCGGDAVSEVQKRQNGTSRPSLMSNVLLKSVV